MNRGIFVSRGEPDINELVETAEGICSYDSNIFACIKNYVREIGAAYLEVCELALKKKREFFGLRDFYSLVKMLYTMCDKERTLTWAKLEHAVKRNFNGLEIDVLEPFRRHVKLFASEPSALDLKSGPIDLIQSALHQRHCSSTSRYLLFITENSSAIDIVQSYLLDWVKVPVEELCVIFGSSFHADQQYTEVCRNISLIKHSMEYGHTVILLNSYNLYESLYDVLNQYYYVFGKQRFVDLGLGTHRVKCAVHENFRLIVIAEKEAVYDSKRFPIPLINRLEKHFLNVADLLNDEQRRARDELNEWVAAMTALSKDGAAHKPVPNEIFVGFHENTTASIVFFLGDETPTLGGTNQSDSMEVDSGNRNLVAEAKKILLASATPDSILRITSKPTDKIKPDEVFKNYFASQEHLSLDALLNSHLKKDVLSKSLVQITTHSNTALSSMDKRVLCEALDTDEVEVCNLKSFDTQFQFMSKIKELFSKSPTQRRFLLVQSDLKHKYSADLISCARHTISEQFKTAVAHYAADLKSLNENFFVVLLIHLPRENLRSFVGFQLGSKLSAWNCYHLDELTPAPTHLPLFMAMRGYSLKNLLNNSLVDKKIWNLDAFLKVSCIVFLHKFHLK